jgi:hypothetical protein
MISRYASLKGAGQHAGKDREDRPGPARGADGYGFLRTETDARKLVALLIDRIDLDLKDLRAEPPRALDYADVIEALLARAELEGISLRD